MSGEALRQEVIVPSPPTLAQVITVMEAAVCDMCVLQSIGDLSGEEVSRWVAWEHDLQAREEELFHRGDQVQQALIDAARQEEALAMMEQHLEVELGAIPAREQGLAIGLTVLEEGHARVRQQESAVWEWER
jgi:hypothetical protein